MFLCCLCSSSCYVPSASSSTYSREDGTGGLNTGGVSEKWFGQFFCQFVFATKILPQISFGSNLLPNFMWGKILVAKTLAKLLAKFVATKILPHINVGSNLLPKYMWGKILVAKKLANNLAKPFFTTPPCV